MPKEAEFPRRITSKGSHAPTARRTTHMQQQPLSQESTTDKMAD
jgi:hypothetical protein